MSEVPSADAQIITFYSYKGGTGRSMAVANLAWILASAGKRLLVIDWDLEAPGLHRYFRPFLVDENLAASPGLIDFVVSYASQAVVPTDNDSKDWYVEHADITPYAVALEWPFADGGSIHFIPAGRQDSAYATRVSTFNWANFYERLGGGALIEAMRYLLKKSGDYDFVLIDSRTGVSDTAGICTIQLPDTLVVCFTYNNQSTDGAVAVGTAAQLQRAASDGTTSDPRALTIFPVPMRVDPFESARLQKRRDYAWTRFETLISHIDPSRRRQYWSEVEVPYVPAFSYEEILAAFRDDSEDPKSILAAMIRISGYLTPAVRRFMLSASPEERQRVLARFASAGEEVASTPTESPSETTIRIAEAIYSRLNEPERQDAKRLWLSLVRVSEAYEVSDIAGVRTPESDLSGIGKSVIDVFVNAGVLRRDGESLVPASETVLKWPRLIEWVNEQRDFLVWRQRLRGTIVQWQEKDETSDLLLTGERLLEARKNLSAHSGDLLVPEASFIQTSQRRVIFTRATAVVLGLIAIAFGFAWFVRSPSRPPILPVKDTQTELLLQRVATVNDPLAAALLLAEVKNPPQEWLKHFEPLWVRPIPRVVLRQIRSITSVGFSPDSKMVVSSSNDGRIAVWSSDNGTFKIWLQAGPLAYQAASLDGRLLMASPPPNAPRPEESRVFAAFVTPERIVTSGRLGTLRLFDAPTGRALLSKRDRRFTGAPLIDSNGQLVVLGGDRQVVVFSSDLSKQVAARQFKDGITDLSLARDTDSITVAAGRCYVFHPGMTDAGRGQAVRLARINARGSILAWADDETVHVGMAGAPKDFAAFHDPILINAMDVDFSGDVVATGGDDGVLRIFNVNTKKSREIVTGHDGPITAVAFSGNGHEVATGSADGTIRIWLIDSKPQPLTSSNVASLVAARTTACLTASQRMQLLDESTDAADKNSRDCEQSKGRLFAASK